VTPPQELQEAPAVLGAFPCHELTEWAADFGVLAGVTNRGADFGLSSAEPAKAVLDRWRSLRMAMRPGFGAVIVAHQCHGTTLAIHQAPMSGWRVEDDTDGHLTDRRGLLLSVTVADCVPVYLVQQGGPWVGLVHAGWRGIAGGVVEQGISRMSELARCAPADIVIHCGVSICGSCYEVGYEVYRSVTGHPVESKRLLDVRANIVQRAKHAGVGRVSVSRWCTAHDRQAFYSHRGSGGTDGRMLAYLGRPSP
jgi:hypothetical protein